jgi:hypothetical protein
MKNFTEQKYLTETKAAIELQLLLLAIYGKDKS